MDGPILVTGGAGNLGGQVVTLLRAAGVPVRVLSRRERADPDAVVGDLDTGEGIEAAVKGVETIVHCAGMQKGDGDKTRTLVAAAGEVRHLVFISVVGADRVPVRSRVDRAMFGFFESKRDAELVVEGSGTGWTTLRATQFHDLVLATVRALARMPVIPVPAGVRFQPVDTAEVAARLAELTLGPPQGLVPDVAGPEILGLAELVRSYLRATGKRRPIVPVRLGGAAYRAVRDGAQLAPDRAVGVRTWAEFLEDH